MSYVNTDNIKLVLTNYGKEQGFKHGLSNVIKYFTVSDDGLIYSMEVGPENLKDINGSHQTSTNIPSGSQNTILKQ